MAQREDVRSLREEQLQRIIGVICWPETKRRIHCVLTHHGEMYDALLH
jgi:hypothetical protein